MSKTQKGEKSDKIDNIVGMLMEYEKMTIDLMRKATDTPILDQYDLNAPYAKARIVKEEGQTKYQIAEVQLADDERKKLKEIRDPWIEDISCNGYGIPIYIWHRKYESIPTNVIFQTAEELDKFILKLSYMSGRAISIAQPVLDATLPDGSRIQMTYEKEVTRR